jgi:predicted DNA-binding transcriptional regulator AlpA
MYEEQRKLDYPYPEISISRSYLEVIDSVLLSRLNQIRESIQGIAPHNDQINSPLPYSKEDLRTSRLGQSLLTIADYVRNGYLYMSIAQIEKALEQVFFMLFGNNLTSEYTLLAGFSKTELGQLIHDAYFYMYGPENWMTAKQAYTTLGISRTSLYDHANNGKLRAIYRSGELRFLRSEIEEWKTKREQRQNRSKS